MDSICGKGLDGVVVDETSICWQDVTGRLWYRGYEIQDLVKNSSFGRVAHLLLHGELPSKSDYTLFLQRVYEAADLPEVVVNLFAKAPEGTPPIDLIRTSTSVLGFLDEDALSHDRLANVRKAERLLGQMLAVVGECARKVNSRIQPVDIDPKAEYAENLLAQLTGEWDKVVKVKKCRPEIVDAILILYAEHEFAPSTFVARSIASTKSDLHSAITGAVGALKGDAHGGAIELSMKQFIEIEKKGEDLGQWVDGQIARGELFMGFGHRVYRQQDRRATILRDLVAENSADLKASRWIQLADDLQVLVFNRFDERSDVDVLHPNLDYSAAYALYLLGLPLELDTPMFACGRVAGWCANVIEQLDGKNKLIRPLSRYIGPSLRAVLGP